AALWMPESAAYVGMLTLLAAPLGLLHRNRRHVLFLSALVLAAIGAAYGLEPMRWLVNHTPVLAGLKNGRMVLIAGFGLCSLAGLGISTLEEEMPFKPNRRALALAVVAAAFVLTFVLIRHLQLATTLRVEFMRRPSFSRALLIVSM